MDWFTGRKAKEARVRESETSNGNDPKSIGDGVGHANAESSSGREFSSDQDVLSVEDIEKSSPVLLSDVKETALKSSKKNSDEVGDSAEAVSAEMNLMPEPHEIIVDRTDGGDSFKCLVPRDSRILSTKIEESSTMMRINAAVFEITQCIAEEDSDLFLTDLEALQKRLAALSTTEVLENPEPTSKRHLSSTSLQDDVPNDLPYHDSSSESQPPSRSKSSHRDKRHRTDKTGFHTFSSDSFSQEAFAGEESNSSGQIDDSLDAMEISQPSALAQNGTTTSSSSVSGSEEYKHGKKQRKSRRLVD